MCGSHLLPPSPLQHWINEANKSVVTHTGWISPTFCPPPSFDPHPTYAVPPLPPTAPMTHLQRPLCSGGGSCGKDSCLLESAHAPDPYPGPGSHSPLDQLSFARTRPGSGGALQSGSGRVEGIERERFLPPMGAGSTTLATNVGCARNSLPSAYSSYLMTSRDYVINATGTSSLLHTGSNAFKTSSQSFVRPRSKSASSNSGEQSPVINRI